MKKVFFTLFLLWLNIDVNAYDNIKVHQLINENAALQSSNFITTLRSLGFTGSSSKEVIELNVINKKKIKDWFDDGAKQEDVPDCRSKYHFHDPTKMFDSAGLSNAAISTACANWSNYSSIKWAQHQNNGWSWQKARNYFYLALTATDKTVREQNLADTFRSVGQVMHLLADMSVPEHVRNDIHILPFFDNATQSFPQIGSWTYETWSKWNALGLNTTAVTADYSTIVNTSNVSGYIPSSNFWDTTPNPGYGGTLLGLAEYTNYNFLSTDTIFRDYTYPVNPASTSGVLKIVVSEDMKHDKRVYFSGVTSDRKPIEHLVSTGYLWADLNNISPFSMDTSKFNLDDNCFKDYTSILVPKAVGYSAGLLNYFFRGDISMRPDDSGPNQYIISNWSPEEMSGTFNLYYDDENSNRIFITKWENITIGPMTDNEQGKIPGQSAPVGFTIPTDPAPKEKNTYILVFQGKMGNEEGAVAGKVVRWWREEWDKGLYGNHTWVHMRGGFPATVDKVNVADGKLVKNNAAYYNIGYQSDSYIGAVTRVKDSGQCYIGNYEYLVDCAVNDQFPYTVTPKTLLRLKVDAMDVQNQPGSCQFGQQNGGCQEIGLKFQMGDGQRYDVIFTTPGNECYTNPGAYVPLGETYSATLYDLFAQVTPIIEPVSIIYINVFQSAMAASDCNATESIQQHMEVDYIRLEEK